MMLVAVTTMSKFCLARPCRPARGAGGCQPFCVPTQMSGYLLHQLAREGGNRWQERGAGLGRILAASSHHASRWPPSSHLWWLDAANKGAGDTLINSRGTVVRWGRGTDGASPVEVAGGRGIRSDSGGGGGGAAAAAAHHTSCQKGD